MPAKSVAPRDLVAAEHMDHWDRYAAPQAGFAEQVAYFQLLADQDGMTRTLLQNAAGRLRQLAVQHPGAALLHTVEKHAGDRGSVM